MNNKQQTVNNKQRISILNQIGTITNFKNGQPYLGLHKPTTGNRQPATDNRQPIKIRIFASIQISECSILKILPL